MKIKTKCFVLLMLLVTLSIITIVKLNNNKNIKLDNVSLKEQISNMNGLAIMTEQKDGSYLDERTIPLKEDGYIFNKTKSGCVDNLGNMINDAIEYRNNMVRVETDATSSCVLYFDLIGDGDFCIEQGITDFSDCLLVMEDYSYDTEEAKEYIENKGSATTSKIAPTITYKSVSEHQTGNVLSFTSTIKVGTGYTFNETTGYYTLTNPQTVTMSDEFISNDLESYYMVSTNSLSNLSGTILYKINAYTKTTTSTGTTYTITDADVYTYKTLDSFDSEVGLYATTDDDGTTYFYRGAVKNNYVSFGGYIWRVIRINGNGTIRMIYSGTSAEEIGEDDQIGTSPYNSKYWDPTYVGYKFSDDNMIYKENERVTTYAGIKNSRIYYYGKYINCSETTKKCQLSGTAEDKISGTWSETYSKALSEGYIYTCFSTSAIGTCYIAFKIDSYVNETQAKVNYISYNSPNYESTLQNKTDSPIKEKVDTWYESNIVGKTDKNEKLVTDYISDEVFCNDRSLYSGSGYLMSPTTNYKSYNRIVGQFKPSLSCSQTSDKFSVVNGNLTYPVALITIDEASLAGGRLNNVNDQYYLYTGQTYWTMSPLRFYETQAYASVWSILSNGSYTDRTPNNIQGVRPVINLKSNVKITKGTGTSTNPYELTIE